MSTRAQIRIIEGGEHKDFYHHFDGYFSYLGEELKAALKKCNGMAELEDTLLNEMKGYEQTENLHGDIEFFYLIDFDKNVYKGFKLGWEPWKKIGNERARFTDLDLVPWLNRTDVEMNLKEKE